MRRTVRMIDGVPLIDAIKPLHVVITEYDIRSALRKDCDMCAAALALCRSVKAIEDARVYLGRAYIRFPGKWVRYKTSEALRAQIVRFDKTGKFQEGRYLLSTPSPSDRLGCEYSRHYAESRAPTARRRRAHQRAEGVRKHAPHIGAGEIELEDDRPEHGRRAGP